MEKSDLKDLYTKGVCGIPYLIHFLCSLTKLVKNFQAYDIVSFLIMIIINSVICAGGIWLSFSFVNKSIEYFGLPKKYITITILCIVMLILSFVSINLFIHLVFPPDEIISKTKTPFLY